VERVVLNALAKETRLRRWILARSAKDLYIGFGEADPACIIELAAKISKSPLLLP
jgi:hypothetical protein